MDPRICSNRFGVKGVLAPVDIDEPCMAVSEATQVR
jgi:hypothetical protein